MPQSHQQPILAALILAAGYSSRMGQFKPLLPLDGKSVIESAIDTFRNAGITRIIVVTGHEAAQLQPLLKYPEISSVHNPDYASGMYSSVQAGIRSLSEDIEACFLLPADIPLVRPATVKTIIGRYESRHPSIIYPVFRGQHGHPPLIARSLFNEILAGNGEGGLRALLQRHEADASEVDVFDEGILLDMDEPEDYERLTKLAPRRHIPTAAECKAILADAGSADSCLPPQPCRRSGRGGHDKTAQRPWCHHRSGSGTRRKPAARHRQRTIRTCRGRRRHRVRTRLPEVAEIIGQHMDIDFDGSSPKEAAIVFLADKLVREDRRVPLEERFHHAFERFRDQPEALRAQPENTTLHWRFSAQLNDWQVIH